MLRRERLRPTDRDEPEARHEWERRGGVDERLDARVAALEYLTAERRVRGLGEAAPGHELERVVQELDVRAVQEQDRRKFAALGESEEPPIVHPGGAQKRSTARLTIERAMSMAADRSADSSREIVCATEPITRKSACS